MQAGKRRSMKMHYLLHWHDGDEIQKALLFRLCPFAVRSFFIDTKLVQETETTRQSGSKTARGS
jgi:hypothetical protein